MAHRPRGDDPAEGTPEYDWLYGGGTPASSGRGARPGDSGARTKHDPEPTRVMPTLNRPSDRSRDRRPPPREPAPPRTAPPPPSGRPPRRRFRFGWFKLALVLWLVFLLAVPFWAWSKVAKVDAEPADERPPSQPGHTYLLVGSDSREGLSAKERRRLGTGKAEGRRTDTIMLLHTGDGPNLLLSLPRDSLVEVPGYGRTKINAAYAYGGPDLLVRTIEDSTGIRIDGYVEIGFGGFVDVVDAVGGIEICPKEPMQDPQANLDIEAGCQEADGVEALGYARSRKTSALGDIDRARRQREVVSAVGSEAASPWSVLNPVRYVRLAGAGAEALRVGKDTGFVDTLLFGWAMTRVSGDTGLTCTVPIADLAVNWDQERAERLFGLIQQDRTSDIPKDLCRPTGLSN